MNFKEFIFTEEINPDDTATVYHRTQSVSTVSDILKSGFQPGGGAYYGKGLYTTISLESQFNEKMLNYGSIIVKFHVTNLDKYLIFHPNIAKRIHGQNSYKLSDQLKKFGLDHKFQPEYLSELDQQQELTGLTNAQNFKNFYEQNYWIQNDPAIKGVIYYGTNDGYCLLKYEPVNDGTITMLAYTKADTSLETMQKLYNNEGWITSTDKAKIRDIQKLPSDRRSDYAQISEFKTSVQLYKFLIRNHLDLNELDTGIKVIINILQQESPLNDKIFDLLLNRSSSDTNVLNLLDYASDKQKMAKLIIKNKKELSNKDVRNLLDFASDKQEIAKLIIQNKKELSDDNVRYLLNYESDKQEIIKLIIKNKKELSDDNVYWLLHATDPQEIAKLIIQNKKENKKEISDSNVYHLLHYASDKKEIESILGKENINKISDSNVYHLLRYASDKQEIASILGQENINKLSDDNVYKLLEKASNKQEIANILGSINISKLSDNHIFHVILSAITSGSDYKNYKEMTKIIDQYYTNKTPEIQHLIHDDNFWEKLHKMHKNRK